MPPKEIEQLFHAAEVNRGEAPCACRKPGLPLVVSLASHDFDRLNFYVCEIDGSGRGSAHTLSRPPGHIRTIGSAQLGQDDHSTSVFVGRCDQRALDVACT